MNLQALFDGVLAVVALWLALGPGRRWPAAKLGGLAVAAAAVMGTLRFSGLLPLPQLHQTLSMLAAAAGLPLLAVSVVWRDAAVARETRYAVIFGGVAAVVCLLVAVVIGWAPWTSLCAGVAVLAMLMAALRRGQWLMVAAALCLAAAFAAFAARLQIGPLKPGDALHIGMALGLAFYGRWLTSTPGEPT